MLTAPITEFEELREAVCTRLNTTLSGYADSLKVDTPFLKGTDDFRIWQSFCERSAMKLFISLILWCFLLVICWPLALILIFLFPLIWLLLLPFKIVGLTIELVFKLLSAILLFPFRVLSKA